MFTEMVLFCLYYVSYNRSNSLRIEKIDSGGVETRLNLRQISIKPDPDQPEREIPTSLLS